MRPSTHDIPKDTLLHASDCAQHGALATSGLKRNDAACDAGAWFRLTARALHAVLFGLAISSCLVIVFRGDPMDERRELTSWKEIAAFLGVNVRTAQKWENERKLPVRRLPGGRGRVAADVAALDAWKRSTPDDNPASGVVYRWPLSKDIIAEVKITGGPVTPAHLEVLRQYLDLAKNAVQTG